MVGYGPNPRECVDLVMKCQMVLLGNHDQGAMFDPEGFNPPAERAIFWTRDAAGDLPGEHDRPANGAGSSSPNARAASARTATSSSTARPATRSTNTSSPKTSTTSARWSASSPWSTATVSRATPTSPASSSSKLPDDLYQFNSPEEIEYAYKLDGRKTLCNVGSVGQPRDGDWRACYVLLDDDTIRYRRVEYDIETTIKKIYAVPELENFLGDRLRDGR